MKLIYALIESGWYWFVCGACAFAVLIAILRNINSQQGPDVLPPPRCDLIARGGKDAWEVGEARVR